VPTAARPKQGRARAEERLSDRGSTERQFSSSTTLGSAHGKVEVSQFHFAPLARLPAAGAILVSSFGGFLIFAALATILFEWRALSARAFRWWLLASLALAAGVRVESGTGRVVAPGGTDCSLELAALS